MTGVMRNKSVDLVRVLALLTVIIYHIWVLSGGNFIENCVIRTFVMLGGELGVIAFFVISGYGIYCACDKMNASGKLDFKTFMKKRIQRVAVEYYISILAVLVLTGAASYISCKGALDIGLHLIFMHNIIPNTAGSISGVLWTMAVIVQFYFVAILLYKLIKRFGIWVPVITIGITVFAKYVGFHFLLQKYPNINAFWISRQSLLSTLDNFVLGMYVAHLLQKRKKELRSWAATGTAAISLVALYFISASGLKYGIHTDNISGYTWHTVAALNIAIGIFMMSNIKRLRLGNGWSGQFVDFLAKHEYGIYVTHLLIIENLLKNSPIVEFWIEKSWICGTLFLMIVSIGVGVLYSLGCNCVRKEIYRE